LDAYLQEIVEIKEFQRKRIDLEKKQEVLKIEKIQMEAASLE
jgi:hypothetical protein